MKNLTYLLITVLLFYSCEKEDILIPSEEFITIESFNTLKGTVSLVAEYAHIDWGDGETTTMDQASANKLTHLYHQYTNVGNYTITLKAKTLENLFVGDIQYNDGLQSTYNVKLGSCPNLSLLGCYYVNKIDVKSCPNLYSVSIYGDNIPFDTKDCPQVKIFDVLLPNGNGGSITIPESTTSLSCYRTGIESLYLSSKIERVDCSDNKLTSLNLSHCNKLYSVDCSNNQIKSFTIPNQAYLTTINCSNNKLSAETLNSIFVYLPEVSKGTINFSGNPGSSICDFNIASEKGWEQ